MSEKSLQTSKKKLSNGKWSYRGYLLKKEGSKWGTMEGDLMDENSIKVYNLEYEKTIKDICFKIDEILGNLPNSQKKVKKKNKTSEEIMSEDLANAKKIAYEVRTELENILGNEPNVDEELKAKGLLAIPFGQGKTIGKNGFVLTWNKKFAILESILKQICEKNPNVDLSAEEKDSKTILKVHIKE